MIIRKKTIMLVVKATLCKVNHIDNWGKMPFLPCLGGKMLYGLV